MDYGYVFMYNVNMAFSKTDQTKSVKKKKKKRPISIGKLKVKIEDLVKLKAKQRDDWTCQHCGKKVEGSDAHGSHVIPVSRSQYLRLDILNIKTLCFKCHIGWWHKHPIEAGEWFKEKFPDRYKYLKERENITDKWKRWELEEMLEKLKK